MTWKWLVLVCSLAFLGLGTDVDCDGHPDPPPTTMERLLAGGTMPTGLAAPDYYKDTRTGLCFATRGTVWDYPVVLVPCGVVEGAAVKAKLEAREQAHGQ